jgi:peptidoglycan/LPS O-acetylase OafA/YrhL
MRQFYARRARRVLPAALVTLVLTAIVYARIATPADQLQALGGFRAAFAYVANWYFVHRSTDYFAPNIATSPVLHFWSLAVEEQFYLLWPLAFGGLWFATRRAAARQFAVLRGAVAAAAVLSAALALHLASNNLERAYYGTDTRVYELLAGAVIALTPRLTRGRDSTSRYARAAAVVAIAGILVLATSALDMSPITRGIWTTLCTGALIVLLERANGGLVRRALAFGPLAYLGRISYGVYLWHWPIVVFVLYDHDVAPLPLFAISGLLSTALAAVSYAVVEQPVRTARALDRLRGPVIATGLTASLIGAVVLAPVILQPTSTTVAASNVDGRSNTRLRLLDWRRALGDIPPLPACLGKPLAGCTVVRGDGKRVLLIGDSNARMWIPTFTAIAKREGWSFAVATRPVCPWQRGLQYHLSAAYREQCRRHQDDWYERMVPKLDPDVVVLAHQAYDDPGYSQSFYGLDGRPVFHDSPRLETVLRDASAASLRALERPGRKVVLLEPTPLSSANPLNCLSRGGDQERCRYRANAEPTPLERFYREYASEHADVEAVDADRLVCPRLPVCDPVVGEIIVKRDGSHITATYARSLAPSVAPFLR